jgi:hypothetical protein
MKRRTIISGLMSGIEGSGPKLERTQRNLGDLVCITRGIVVVIVDLEFDPSLPTGIRREVTKMCSRTNDTPY